ncbi:hypothetical protein AB0C76_15470 [Kitasatospora sp. NPDC048722]|uniref:hypothetical protein n=1 Tax=Kitasatospora sp. NPDC048722 TaxID=3155639 RepID=UPI003401D13D
MDRLSIPWKRRAYPLGQPPESDRDGWPMVSAYAGSAVGKPLAQERATPFLAILGERGAGKSFALQQEHDELKNAGHPVAWLDLKRCGEAALARANLSRALRPPAAGGEWHVFLDGLDEGLDDLPVLDQLITAHLEDLDAAHRSVLRLRISCRTARWPTPLEEDLRRVFHQDHVKIMALAPLTRDDVALAARIVGVQDTTALTALLEQRGLVALATQPVTLRPLLIRYAEGKSLPATAEQAYLQACLHLCAENRRPKNPLLLQAQASPGHLLAVAARIAAAMQFGRYKRLSDVPERSDDPTDLHLSYLDSGDEPGYLTGSVQCTVRELRQVCESSLLAPVGDLRWVFAHHSYQEFLAAHFLRTRGMDPVSQRELLWIGDGQARHVVTAHQEVAAWLSTSDTTAFDDLLRDDPQVLLLADLPTRPDQDRSRTVDALLRRLEQDDTQVLQHTLLYRLDHPQLPDQLRPHLHPSTEVNLLYGAASIARACRRPELATQLLDLAQDGAVHVEVRVAAVAGVATTATDEIERIRELSKDPSPEVAAAALSQLWPDHITLPDFLDRVRDPNPGYIGTAYLLRREVPEQLGPTEIGEAVAWACRTLGDAQSPGSPALATAVLARAVTLADQATAAKALLADVGEALVALAARTDLLHSSQAHSARQDLVTALEDAPHARRSLALHLFRNATNRQFFNLLSGLPHGSFLPSTDALYWMTHWNLLSHVPADLARSAVAFPAPQDAGDLARAQEARAAHPSLREATAFWDQPTPEQPWEREHREREELQRRHNTFDESDLRAAIAAVHTAAPDTLRSAWLQVVWQLHRTADGSPAPGRESLLLLAENAPSRPPAGSDLARLLEQAALHVLATAPALHADDLTPHGAFDVNRAPELTALAVATDLTMLNAEPGQWAGWALALASTEDTDTQELRRRLLPLCVQRAGNRLPNLLTQALDGAHDYTVRVTARAFAARPECGAGPALRTWASRPGRDPEQWQAVLAELATTGDTEARRQLAAALDLDPSDYAQDSPERRRWLLAARTLLHGHDDDPTLWPTIRCRLDDPAILADLLRAFAASPVLPGTWPPAIGRLPENDLADLYTLLVEKVGVSDLPPPRTGILSERDNIADLIRSLPDVLASRATLQAAAQLHALAHKHPQIWQLRRQARATALAAAAAQAEPVSVEQLFRLADDARLRRIADARQLLDVVVESLGRFEQALHRPNGLIVSLWNRNRAAVNHSNWWPCWEEDFSDVVATFLLHDIGGHRVVINREVQLCRPGFPGRRTDIQIEAPAPEGSGQEPIKVVIECKGCWNPSLNTALARQLVDGYLQTPSTAGVLLTAYFDCGRWGRDKRDQRRCPAHGHSLDEVRAHQEQQAQEQSRVRGLPVAAVTLDCRLPDAT